MYLILIICRLNETIESLTIVELQYCLSDSLCTENRNRSHRLTLARRNYRRTESIEHPSLILVETRIVVVLVEPNPSNIHPQLDPRRTETIEHSPVADPLRSKNQRRRTETIEHSPVADPLRSKNQCRRTETIEHSPVADPLRSKNQRRRTEPIESLSSNRNHRSSSTRT